MQKFEKCIECGENTGRAGKGEDSIYCESCDLGPFCERCRADHSCDVCGLCGKGGADKIAHPIHWPGEQVPDGPMVHAECEAAECKRAHAALSDAQRRAFLRTV